MDAVSWALGRPATCRDPTVTVWRPWGCGHSEEGEPWVQFAKSIQGVEKTGHSGLQLSRRSCHSGRAYVSADLATSGPEHLTMVGVFEKLSISLISNSNHMWLQAAGPDGACPDTAVHVRGRSLCSPLT